MALNLPNLAQYLIHDRGLGKPEFYGGDGLLVTRLLALRRWTAELRWTGWQYLLGARQTLILSNVFQGFCVDLGVLQLNLIRKDSSARATENRLQAENSCSCC